MSASVSAKRMHSWAGLALGSPRGAFLAGPRLASALFGPAWKLGRLDQPSPQALRQVLEQLAAEQPMVLARLEGLLRPPQLAQRASQLAPRLNAQFRGQRLGLLQEALAAGPSGQGLMPSLAK